VLALLAVCLPAGAGAQAVRLSAAPHGAGLVVRLVGVDGSHRVTLSLGGRTLARDLRAPYRVALGGVRVSASGATALVARDAGSGRSLASLRVAAGRQTPVVAITSAPAGTTTATATSIAFSVSVAGTITCSLDGAAPAACSSPVSYFGLQPGPHAVTVSDRAGGRTGSASTSWTILAAAPAPAADIAPPAAPAGYTVPAGAVAVSTSAQLTAALAKTTPTDIVLADGTYDDAAPFSDAYDHRLYAAHLGGAVLKAGIVLGGNFGRGGALLRGLAFDVGDPAKTFEGGIVQTWGASGRNATILDTTFDGNDAVGAGILARQVEGLVVRRVVAQNFRSYGVFADANVQNAAVATPPVLEDISVSHVSAAVPKSSNGTAEACIWIGNTATLQRARVRDCAWMGFWSGTSFSQATVSDLDVDQTPIGLYLEHFSSGSTYRRLLVGRNVSTGVNCEWADPAWGGKPGCNGDVIENSTFRSSRVGVYLDEGTTNVTVRGCTFDGQSWAGIGNYKGVGNSVSGNDFSRLGDGAVGISAGHL
jgi:hypothetical protein